jgi:hypothetical protein
MHKNARLTPKGRQVMLARLQAAQHQIDVAQAMGISLTTVKKWVRRYWAEGAAGLLDRSSRPARCRYSQMSSAMTLPPGSSSSIAAYGPRPRSTARRRANPGIE